jgi:hypothetical protein
MNGKPGFQPEGTKRAKVAMMVPFLQHAYLLVITEKVESYFLFFYIPQGTTDSL